MFGMKTDQNRFRLYFKPDQSGRVREIFINAEEFAMMNDRFEAIYKKMGSVPDGSLLIEDENPADFVDYVAHGLNSFDPTDQQYNETTPLPGTGSDISQGADACHRLLPIAHRWSTFNTTGYLFSLHITLVHPDRDVTLPIAIGYLRALCNMAHTDDGSVRYASHPALKHVECSLSTQIRHRITELVMYLAEFKTPALQAAGVEQMEEVPEKVKRALFYLAKQLDHNKKSDVVVNGFLQMLNGSTEKPKRAPDALSEVMSLGMWDM